MSEQQIPTRPKPAPMPLPGSGRPADFEVRDERGNRAAGAALGVVVVLAVIMAVLATVSFLTGCGSALADQCEALYAGAQQASAAAHTESEVADARARTVAADAACGADGGAP